MTRIPSDIALPAATAALKICAAIRRDHGWTKSDDSATRFAAVLRDLEENFLPRCEPHIVRLIADAIVYERAAWDQRYADA